LLIVAAASLDGCPRNGRAPQDLPRASVLAIQNARLFSELDEKSRQLEIESKHKSQFLANMSTSCARR